MSDLKIAVIGAGSPYTPELIEGLARFRSKLPVREIYLMDINERRLEIIFGFCKRFAKHLDYDVKIEATTDRRKAIENANFINTQIRVGGNERRVLDEKIPLKYGIIGQETTGPGGFMKAMCTIPVMTDIVKDAEKYSPNAWIVNYTNPTGLITEALTKYTGANVVGLCAGGMRPGFRVAKALSVDYQRVKYDYVGLNHMNFAFNFTVDGRPLTKEEFNKAAQLVDSVDTELIKKMGLMPSAYMQYYFHTSKKLQELKKAKYTRGEEVLMLEKEIYDAYADPRQNTKPAALAKRGGGGYSEVALGVMKAIYNDEDRWLVVNVPNNGAIKILPDDAVIETPCMINRAGIKPLAINNVPSTVWGLICAVKNYEQLAVEAAVKGDRDLALYALLAHPLVRDYDIAKSMLEEMLEVNKEYLPQFYK
jgi:6-phospho-beta-glucosidase